MSIFCPSVQKMNDGKNCLIDCKNANNCNDNQVFVESNDIQTSDFEYLCSSVNSNEACNNSMIHCAYNQQMNEYQQQCPWIKVENEWNCYDENQCVGQFDVVFLSILNSSSTIVFILMMAFGVLVVFMIFVYSMREKYAMWKKEKEFARKWSHKEKGKQKGLEKRRSQMTTNDNKKRYELAKNGYDDENGYSHNGIIEEETSPKSTKKTWGFNKKNSSVDVKTKKSKKKSTADTQTSSGETITKSGKRKASNAKSKKTNTKKGNTKTSRSKSDAKKMKKSNKKEKEATTSTKKEKRDSKKNTKTKRGQSGAKKPKKSSKQKKDEPIANTKSKNAQKFKRSKKKNDEKQKKNETKTKSKSVEAKSKTKGGKVLKKRHSLISLSSLPFGSRKRSDSNSLSESQSSIVSSIRSFGSILGMGKKETLPESSEEPLPQLLKMKSSPLSVRKIRNLHFMDFLWDCFYASQVYGGALFHAWDIATDFGVLFFWLENNEDRWLIFWSIIAMLVYRFLSALVLARQFGWQWGILQFLDLTIYIEAYRSLKNPWCVYTRELKWIRRMEAIFESFPQALLQLAFLMKSGDITESFNTLIVLSFASSVMSIAFSVARDDEAHFELDAMSFTVPYFKSKAKRDEWHAKNDEMMKQKEKKKKKKKDKKKSYVQKRKEKEKEKEEEIKNKNVKKETITSMVAMYELKQCYEEPDEYEPDEYENTIWLPNWKYIIRFLFRFVECTARILTAALIWIAFSGPVMFGMGLLYLIIYFLLQLTGSIGLEWGNIMTFLTVHPNLTLKTDINKSERPKLLKTVMILYGWWPLHKFFGFDLVETHFIHRFIETIMELTAISVGIYGFDCCGVTEVDAMGNSYNTKEILLQPFGISILVTAFFCCILTPLLYHFIVSKWVKKSTSLENNLFGLIRLFDKKAIETFLDKSNRSDALINSLSPQGNTPLSLAAEIGFYDIFETLEQYGAHIDGTNKKGETAVFIFAKSFVQKFMFRGLEKLNALGADFSAQDKIGWSPAIHAIENGNIKFIDWLFKNQKFDALAQKDFDNRSIAHYAAIHDYLSILERINKTMKKRKLLMAKDEDNRLPLHYAFEHQNANVAKFLMDRNQKALYMKDNSDESPLILGARFGEVSFFNDLKAAGYHRFRIFLNPVASEGEKDTLEWLLRQSQTSSRMRYRGKALGRYKDNETEKSPMHCACEHGHNELIALLGKYKFPVNDTDIKHRTPAFYAAKNGHLKCLMALYKLNANFGIENSKGLTPLDVARKHGKYNCVPFLEEMS